MSPRPDPLPRDGSLKIPGYPDPLPRDGSLKIPGYPDPLPRDGSPKIPGYPDPLPRDGSPKIPGYPDPLPRDGLAECRGGFPGPWTGKSVLAALPPRFPSAGPAARSLAQAPKASSRKACS